MANALIGKYKGKVCDVDLGIVGEKDTVMLSVVFNPYAELVGADWRHGKFNRCKRPYWLSDKVISKGQSAGKTSIEVTREQIKETYGYEGPLEAEALKAGLMDRDVELTCKDDGKGYTEVEYVNPPGGGRKGFKKLKEVPQDKLAQLAAHWSGKAPEEKHVDPKSLFESMTKLNEGAA